MPNGKPITATASPGATCRLEPMVAGCKSSGIFCGLRTAKSLLGWVATTRASDSVPSAKVMSRRCDPQTTCKLVRIMPSSVITTPVPTPISSSCPLCLGCGPKLCTRTTEPATWSTAGRAGEGQPLSSNMRSKTWLMGSGGGVGLPGENHHTLRPTIKSKPLSPAARRPRQRAGAVCSTWWAGSSGPCCVAGAGARAWLGLNTGGLFMAMNITQASVINWLLQEIPKA